jgi:hypothetical protein
MSGKLALTRSTKPNKDELFFFVEDSNGNIIQIKQTFIRALGGQIRMSIEAGKNVQILRGELLERTPELMTQA